MNRLLFTTLFAFTLWYQAVQARPNRAIAESLATNNDEEPTNGGSAQVSIDSLGKLIQEALKSTDVKKVNTRVGECDEINQKLNDTIIVTAFMLAVDFGLLKQTDGNADNLRHVQDSISSATKLNNEVSKRYLLKKNNGSEPREAKFKIYLCPQDNSTQSYTNKDDSSEIYLSRQDPAPEISVILNLVHEIVLSRSVGADGELHSVNGLVSTYLTIGTNATSNQYNGLKYEDIITAVSELPAYTKEYAVLKKIKAPQARTYSDHWQKRFKELWKGSCFKRIKALMTTVFKKDPTVAEKIAKFITKDSAIETAACRSADKILLGTIEYGAVPTGPRKTANDSGVRSDRDRRTRR